MHILWFLFFAMTDNPTSSVQLEMAKTIIGGMRRFIIELAAALIVTIRLGVHLRKRLL